MLYEEILGRGGLPASDPRVAEGGELRRGLELLHAMGLVQHEPESDLWVAEEPSSAQSRIVTPLSYQGAKLIEESSEWARALGVLTQAWRKSPQSQAHGPFTYLRGPAIEPYIGSLVAECEEEMLTAQPQSGRHANRSRTTIAMRDSALLERGARMRTLYQHSARRSPATRRYVAEVAAHGGEVRTLDEFFNRMIVIDRRVAVIPNQDDLSVAVAIREPAIVAYLVDVFERSWERARPFTSREDSLMRDIAAEQRAMTVRMLIEGHADQVSAKRLGVSPRTYAGYVADLKAEYDVETRFQLGYVMGQAGVSRDPDEDQRADS